MATIIKNFTGKASLDELNRACGNIQDTQKAKLVHLQGAIDEAAAEADKFINQAQFATVQRRKEIYDDLIFIPIEDESKIPSIIAEQLANQALLIFNEVLIVQGKETRVLGFGKFD